MFEKNNDFTKILFSQKMLDACIEWIQKNLEPDDVFDEEQLIKWYKEHIELNCDDEE